jgi:peroxiredoxin Q/BCP
MAVLAVLGLGAGVGRAASQEKPTPLAVGEVAPEFALSAATKSGVSPQAAKLTDFRGQTVVLAFFYKARTGG